MEDPLDREGVAHNICAGWSSSQDSPRVLCRGVNWPPMSISKLPCSLPCTVYQSPSFSILSSGPVKWS
jgi:hypothetical protein